MTLNRVSTYDIHQTTLRNASAVQNRLYEAQIQVSSGLKASTFMGLDGGMVEQFTTLQNKLTKAEGYLQTNKVAQTRLSLTATAIQQVMDNADNLKNLIIQRRNATLAPSIGFPQQLEGFFKSIAGQMNTSYNGSYIFSGTRTDQPAVRDDALPINAVPGTPDAGYYLGNTQDISLRVQDSFVITPNIRADDEGFQDIMAGIATAFLGDQQGDDLKLARAFDLLQSGVQRLRELSTKVNANNVLLDQAVERQNMLQVYFKGLIEETANADIVSLSTQVAVDQSVLQASFQIFSKINSLQLSDFLR